MLDRQFLFASVVAALVLAGVAVGGLLGTSLVGLLAGAALAIGGAVLVAWMRERARPDVPATIAAALADRYADNFVRPVARALTEEANASRRVTSIRILIPDRAARREALTQAVTEASTPEDVIRGGGQRSFGVYVHASGGRREVVDVPSTLRGLEDVVPGGGTDGGQRAYARFAERLREVMNDDPPALSVQVETGVETFPQA